jgi:Mo-dependent nitrogenase C-terminus
MAAAGKKHFALKNGNLLTPHRSCLNPLRQWIDQLKISNESQANRLCRLIPAQCPFERDIKILGYTVLHIPPLCQLNPLYAEVVALRWRALCYLADECGADVSKYC